MSNNPVTNGAFQAWGIAKSFDEHPWRMSHERATLEYTTRHSVDDWSSGCDNHGEFPLASPFVLTLT